MTSQRTGMKMMKIGKMKRTSKGALSHCHAMPCHDRLLLIVSIASMYIGCLFMTDYIHTCVFTVLTLHAFTNLRISLRIETY